MKVSGPDISKYGVIIPDNKTGSIKGIIEKPNFESAPSDLVSIGRYVLTPDIFDILRNQAAGVGGEIQLADSINVRAVNNMVETVLLDGKRFDCGSVKGYVEAIRDVASNYKFDQSNIYKKFINNIKNVINNLFVELINIKYRVP